ncbi:MAG: prolipoprotein diacylglyceryl transferase [Candidatus Berkelbacteria bacterium]|nr:prolipoprotein diacylglyceryl transferase [Candidatus Berkelbacteria bacterium]
MSSPGAIAFDLGLWQIRWYGVLVAGAVLLSYFICARFLKKEGISSKQIDGSYLSVLVLGLIGARIGHVVQYLSYYFKDPVQMFEIWNGGLSIHGAIIGGALGLLLAQFVFKVRLMTLANAISPQVLLSVAIGRWGNFFNEEITGRPYDGLFKLYVSPASRPLGFEGFEYFRPVFFYESALLFLAYFLFLILRAKLGFKSGFVYTLIIYNAVRFFVQFWRMDYKPIFGPFDLAQTVSFAIIIGAVAIGVFTLTFRRK